MFTCSRAFITVDRDIFKGGHVVTQRNSLVTWPETGMREITPEKSASVYECAPLPIYGLSGMSLDENRVSHELGLPVVKKADFPKADH
jgi:hypothetical protein